MDKMKRAAIPAILALGLSACGDGNPFGALGGVISGAVGDPNTTNERFAFDESRFLTANQFTYDPATNTVSIDNLPFDGVSSSGGTFATTAAILPDGGEIYANAPGAGEDQYYAVLVRSGATTTLAGSVGTNAWQGFGYGGAYASRPSGGLPPTQTATYVYTGNYGGVRVLRQGGGATNVIQTTSGVATIDVDLQNLTGGGSTRGTISGRTVCNVAGGGCVALQNISLFNTTIDAANARSDVAPANTLNADASAAQTGTWEGSFSGPAGQEIVGYVVIEGAISDLDPDYDAATAVDGREVGGFVAARP